MVSVPSGGLIEDRYMGCREYTKLLLMRLSALQSFVYHQFELVPRT